MSDAASPAILRAPSWVSGDPSTRSVQPLDPRLGLWLGVALIGLLAASPWLPTLQAHPISRWVLWGAALVGALWLGALWRGHKGGRALAVVPHLKASHYLQLVAQGIVYVAWAAHWAPVVDHLPLIGVQLVFAYLLELLLGWSRYRTFRLGLGIFPILGSINFFLWFTPAWFGLQIALIAVVWAFREWAKWSRDGRAVHIFNPSAVGLTLMCLLLAALGHEGRSVGEAIAVSQDETPYIYLAIFCAGLVVQTFFPVVLMTFAAALGAALTGWIYLQATGAYLFVATAIPGAIFLGMLLLITDPVTAPRGAAGKVLYGGLYGVTATLLYWLLVEMGQPTYYDKILAVPVLNLSVRAIDRWLAPSASALGVWARGRAGNLAHVALWAGAFVWLRPSLVAHPAAALDYWAQACDRALPRACENMVTLHMSRCEHGEVAACHNLAVMYDSGERLPTDQGRAATLYGQACDAGDALDCGNLATMLWSGEGVPAQREEAIRLWQLACGRPGGAESCENLERMRRAHKIELSHGVTCDGGSGLGCFRHAMETEATLKRPAFAALMGRACELKFAPGCANLALMYLKGDGVEREAETGKLFYERACELGMEKACEKAKAVVVLPKMPNFEELPTPRPYPGGADPLAGDSP